MLIRESSAGPSNTRQSGEGKKFTARKDLDKINRAFFVPESLDIEEAAKVAKKPRLGDAEFLFKDWNLERLFETSVSTSAYTGIG